MADNANPIASHKRAASTSIDHVDNRKKLKAENDENLPEKDENQQLNTLPANERIPTATTSTRIRRQRDLTVPAKSFPFERLCLIDEALTHYFTTTFLPPSTILSLYAISKRFYLVVSRHLTSYMLSAARQISLYPKLPRHIHPHTQFPTERLDAPESELPEPLHADTLLQILPWNHYRHLDLRDSQPRTLSTDPTMRRDTPSLRYLLFLSARVRTAHSIILSLALAGHRLPSTTTPVLLRLGFLLDLPDNARRLGLLHNPHYWSDAALRLATLFFVKLDMVFTDPVFGARKNVARKMMLAQRSLGVLARVLRRDDARTEMQVAQMYIRWKHDPEVEDAGLSVFGVPPQEVGKLQYEGWGMEGGRHVVGVPAGRGKMLRPDELVMGEGIRRQLRLDRELVDMMLWGFIDGLTLEDLPSMPRRLRVGTKVVMIREIGGKDDIVTEEMLEEDWRREIIEAEAEVEASNAR